jgi:hypothetical protein
VKEWVRHGGTTWWDLVFVDGGIASTLGRGRIAEPAAFDA